MSWYAEGLGFISLFTIPGSNGVPALVHLRRWRFQGPAGTPSAGGRHVGHRLHAQLRRGHDEIDALAERARTHGAGRVEEPVDTPWNTGDLTTADPDGNVVVFTAARPPELADSAFSEQMKQWNSEQGLSSPS